MKRFVLSILAALILALAAAAPAGAAAPVLSIVEVNHSPVTVRANDESLSYTLRIKNTGTAPTLASPATSLFAELPAGLELAEGGGAGSGWSCDLSTQSCSNATTVAPGAEFTPLNLLVWVRSSQAGAVVDANFVANGGGTAEDANVGDGFSFAPAVAFGLTGLTAQAEDEAKLEYTEAGGHPFSATSSFALATHRTPRGESAVVEGLRDLFFNLPPGFLGNPQAISTMCTVADIEKTTPTAVRCPEAAAVGGVGVEIPGSGVQSTPLYRIVPEEGYVAAFGFKPLEIGAVTVVIRVKVRSNGDYGVTAVAPLPPQEPELLRAEFVTLCGYGAKAVPGVYATTFIGCKKPGSAGSNPLPFLTNPTRCAGAPPVTSVNADSFQHPGAQNAEGFPLLSDPNWKLSEVTAQPISGCNHLEFAPSFAGRPTTNVADAPSGLEFNLHIPQAGLTDRESLAPAQLRAAKVALPAGMAVNPAAAGGLEACGSAQIGLTTPIGQSPAHFSGFPADCPGASKLGTVEVSTPLLDKPLTGSVYLAKQGDNPFGSLLALYIAISDPETGVVVKLAGRVTPDPVTGQIFTSFDENPQLPFEDLKLEIFKGARASLRTPATCGLKSTGAEFTPWSAPESGPPATSTDSFETTTAPGGGNCPRSAGELPNAPRFSAGTVSPKAGAYSPFVLKLSREDGSQELKGLSAILPPGLSGRLAGVVQCSEAQLAQAISRAKPGEGALEQASPSCPAASEVGTVDVAAGAGPLPYHASGRVYLTGPYKGAPISLAVVTPAIAGPFDLGTVVVRNALHVDPRTAQVSVKSDPIPTILEGIPLDVRSIAVSVTRNQFTLNPTSCEPMSIAAMALGASTDAALAERFQVGECSSLAFKPDLRIQLHGSTRRAGYPRLVATVTAKSGEANIARAAVALPHSAFLAQEHIGTVCTRVQFAAKQCPPGSVYGHATAVTPLLDEPLTGPVYLRSSSNPLPDLVAALRGPDSQPIEVELAGRTDSKNGGIRNTFDLVPDAPVSKFTLQLFGGRKSLIVNSRNLCKGTQRATVNLVAQNGKQRNFRPAVENDCGRRKAKGHK